MCRLQSHSGKSRLGKKGRGDNECIPVFPSTLTHAHQFSSQAPQGQENGGEPSLLFRETLYGSRKW